MTMKSRMMGMAIVQSLHLYPYCVCRVSYVAIITHNYCISSPADDDLAILAIITQISPFPVDQVDDNQDDKDDKGDKRDDKDDNGDDKDDRQNQIKKWLVIATSEGFLELADI